jgi:CHAD domain-containing protein
MNTPVMERSTPEVPKLLLAALENKWRSYRAELKRCRAEFSNEAVHDLRVATRRMLALIQLLNSIAPQPRFRKMIRTFKAQLDEFDDLRDTQVILATLSEILPGLPQLQGFQKHQQTAEEKMLGILHKKIKKFDTSKITKRIQKTRASMAAEVRDDTQTKTLQAVDDAYLLTRQRLSGVDPARSATIHRVRIAFKSFRYMVEMISPLVKDFPENNFKQMDGYQSLMGEIQDAEVFIRTLAAFSKDVSFPEPDPVHHYDECRHAESISAYLAAMDQLDAFWRLAPDRPFPWEK